MSIIKAFENAYTKAEKRGYDTIYVCVDLHDTIIKSTYDQSGIYEFINEDTKLCLRELSTRKEICLILWSSLKEDDKFKIDEFLFNNRIVVPQINENMFECDTKFADFSEKFYFSILIDDKAGFDPNTDWNLIREWYKQKKTK